MLPADGEWRELSAPPVHLNGHSMAAWSSTELGLVLFCVGGRNPPSSRMDGAQKAVWMYSVTKDEWSKHSQMRKGRWGHATVVSEDRMWVLGGEECGSIEYIDLNRSAESSVVEGAGGEQALEPSPGEGAEVCVLDCRDEVKFVCVQEPKLDQETEGVDQRELIREKVHNMFVKQGSGN